MPLLLCVLISCQDKQSMADLEEFKSQTELEKLNKSVVQRYWDGKWNERRIEIFDELMMPDVVYHGISETINGREEYKQAYLQFFNSFHDTKFEVNRLIAEGDLVMSQAKFSGINQKEFMGIPPTGKEVSIIGFTVFRLVDGKIAEEWEVIDQLGMMLQLGMELKMKEQAE